MNRVARLFTSLAALMSAGLIATSAAAEVVVLQSTAPGLSAGTVLADGDTIKIPSGKSAILVLPSGSTKTVNGPVNAKAGDFSKGQSRNAALLHAVKTYVQTGGTTSGSVGATRSAIAGPGGTNLPFSWTRIPVSASGDYCIARSNELDLVREVAIRPIELTIVHMETRKRAMVAFDQGTGEIDWPKDIEAVVGKYAFVMDGAPMRQVRLRVIDPLPNRDEVLRVLFTNRCEQQVEAFLRSLQN